MPAQGPPVSFRDKAVEAELANREGTRSSRGTIAARDLGRYYEMLRRELRGIRLTRGEALAIMDACNGTLWESHTANLIWASIDDTEWLDRKWGIDQDVLVDKLRALSYSQCLALVDAAERFWADGAITDYDEALERIGLVVKATA